MTPSGQSSQHWSGMTGVVNEILVREACDGLAAPIYYLAGPPMMVEGMRDMLYRVGTSEDDIRGEAFSGY